MEGLDAQPPTSSKHSQIPELNFISVGSSRRKTRSNTRCRVVFSRSGSPRVSASRPAVAAMHTTGATAREHRSTTTEQRDR